MQAQKQQPAPVQAGALGPNQAGASGAPNQPPAKVELDFSALGQLAAMLGVGSVKLPAPAQPAISQGERAKQFDNHMPFNGGQMQLCKLVLEPMTSILTCKLLAKFT